MAIALISGPTSPGGGFLCNIGIEETDEPPIDDCQCGWSNPVRIQTQKKTSPHNLP